MHKTHIHIQKREKKIDLCYIEISVSFYLWRLLFDFIGNHLFMWFCCFVVLKFGRFFSNSQTTLQKNRSPQSIKTDAFELESYFANTHIDHKSCYTCAYQRLLTSDFSKKKIMNKTERSHKYENNKDKAQSKQNGKFVKLYA